MTVGGIARGVVLCVCTLMLSGFVRADEEAPNFGVVDEAGGVNLDVDTRMPAATGRATGRALMLDAARAGNRLVAVGERGIINYSDDQGATWRQAEVPVNVLLTAVYFADPRHGWAVGHDAVILTSADAGATWTVQNYAPELDVPLLDVWFADTRRGFAVGGAGWVFATEDGGSRWERREISAQVAEVDIPDSTYEFAPHWFGIAPLDAGKMLFLAGEKGVLMRSDDAGRTWRQLGSPYHGTFFGLVSHAEELFAFGMNGHLFRSTDRGETWNAIAGSGEKSLFVALPTEDGRVLVGGGGGTLLEIPPGDAARMLPTPDRKDVLGLLTLDTGRLLVFTSGGGARALSGS